MIPKGANSLNRISKQLIKLRGETLYGINLNHHGKYNFLRSENMRKCKAYQNQRKGPHDKCMKRKCVNKKGKEKDIQIQIHPKP